MKYSNLRTSRGANKSINLFDLGNQQGILSFVDKNYLTSRPH